ncbi:hypothetical protein Tco_0727601 [Tanacetum coccineum]|uniref:Reverse transcriptase Ty1/copia-type domain-containing protein n=1 Tax=Tanacetum coccineum TaxID=301880 RepID=A0ABQ4YJR2_9ASTR
MLKKFGLEDSKPMKTPMSTETKLTKDEEGESVDNTKYRGMIGSLLYLTTSRPDIMFSVCLCARFQEDPKTSHLEAVKRIFRYVKGTTHLGLWYPKGSGIETIVYADSDHAGDYVDRKSTSGICTFMGCCLTSWFSKKQTALAISTTEAEYDRMLEACFSNDDRWGDGTKNDGRFTFYQACGKDMQIGVFFHLVDSTPIITREGARNVISLGRTILGYYPVRLIPSKTTNAPTTLAFHRSAPIITSVLKGSRRTKAQRAYGSLRRDGSYDEEEEAKPTPKKPAPAAAKNGKKEDSSSEDSSDDDSDYEEEVKAAPTKQPAADAALKSPWGDIVSLCAFISWLDNQF